MDGLKGLCEQTLEGEKCMAMKYELDKCIAKNNQLQCELDKCKQAIRVELEHSKEEDAGYSKIIKDLSCQVDRLKKDNSKMMAELDRYRIESDNLEESSRAIREENIALKGQIEAYRYCIENLKR